MKVLLSTIAFVAIALLVTSGGVLARERAPRPVPQTLEEAREHVKHATDEIRAASDLLEREGNVGSGGGDRDRDRGDRDRERAPSLTDKVRAKISGLFGGGSQSGDDFDDTYDELKDKARGAKDTARDAYDQAKSKAKELTPELYDKFMHKLKSVIGTENPAAWERISSTFGFDRSSESFQKLKDIFGDEAPTEDKLWKLVQYAVGPDSDSHRRGFGQRVRSAMGTDNSLLSGSDFFHKLKVSIGVEDPTTWEKIKSFFGSKPGLVSDDTKQTLDYYVEQVKEALAGLDPTHRDTTLEKIKKALGLQTSVYDQIRHRYGQAVDKADEIVRGSTYDQIVHRLKMAVGAEDPTLWEKIQSVVQPRETTGDKIKHAFGRDTGITRAKLWAKLSEVLSDMDPTKRESYSTKFKKAIGWEPPSLYDRLKGKAVEGFEKAKEGGDQFADTIEYLTGTSFDDAVHQIKVVLGAEDPTIKERIAQALHLQPSLSDKVKGALGRASGMSKEALYGKVEEALASIDPARRDSMLVKVKKALGFQKPTVTDRLKDTAFDVYQKGKEGNEQLADTIEYLTGTSYDDAIHQIKVALGAEDPTIKERISKALNMEPSLMDKVKGVLGRASGISKEALYGKVEEALAEIDPSRRDTTLVKVKKALRLQKPSLFERIKEKVGEGYESAQEGAEKVADTAEYLTGTSYDEAIHKIKVALGAEDPTIKERISKALNLEPSLMDKVKGVLGRTTGMTKDELFSKIQDALSEIDPTRRDTMLVKVKKALGFQKPSLMDRFRESLSSEAQDKLEDAADWGKAAWAAGEVLTGSKYDDAVHQIKVALGAEDPTIKERIVNALNPQPSLIDKVKGYMGSTTGMTKEQLFDKVQEALSSIDPSRRDTMLVKVKKALGFQKPSLFERFKEKVGSGYESAKEGGDQFADTIEYLTGTSYDDAVHQIKVALGAEDPTIKERISKALNLEPSLMDKVKGVLGRASGISKEALYGKVEEALAEIDPSRRDTMLVKVKKALGLQKPSLFDRIKEKVGSGYESAKDTGDQVADTIEYLTGTSYDDAVHQIKVALGAEDPTIKERISKALNLEPSLMDKVKGVLGRASGISKEALYGKVEEALAEIDPTRRDPILVKVKKALGFQKPSLMDRFRDRLSPDTQDKLEDAAEWGKEALSKAGEVLTGSKYDDAVHQIKVALGAEDPTIKERIANALNPQPSLIDKVKGYMGSTTGMTKEQLFAKVQESLASVDPSRRDSMLVKVKKALGLQKPSLFDRLRDSFGSDSDDAVDSLSDWGKDVADKASEMLSGDKFDDALHNIKVAFGYEDPSIQEKIFNALKPQSFTDKVTNKVKHFFGRDTGISRGDLAQRVQDALEDLDPRQRESYMSRIKKAVGLESEDVSFFDRAKDKLGQIFSGRGGDPLDQARDALEEALGSGKKSIDSVLEQLKVSTPENRDQLFRELKKQIASASDATKEKTNALYKLLSGESEEKVGMGEKFSGLYHSLQNTAENWMRSATEFANFPTSHGQYLYQSSKQENGIAAFYVNDNGKEFVDITGEKLDPKNFNKLEWVNSFRRELDLEEYESLPDTCTVQVHTIKRPHVFVKAFRTIDGNKFEYIYDDGQETLTTEWRDLQAEKPMKPEQTQHLLRMFRQDHGLSMRPISSDTPTIRSKTKHSKKDAKEDL